MKILDFDLEGSHFIIEADIAPRQEADDDIIYFCIRRGMADEMDQKKWNNRIVVAVVSCIGAVLGSATLNLILGYYQ